MLIGIGPAIAHTLHVPAQYATIQHALIAASDGDTVLVAPGVYYEDIVWPERQSLLLISQAGPEATTIDAMDTDTVIRIAVPVDTTTRIEGFTITHGRGEMGGGIACISAAPTIRGNRIVDNVATYYGAGIHCSGEGHSPVIQGNTLCRNSVVDGSGGGICCYEDAYPVILDNDFRDNSADAYYGGGIHCEEHLGIGGPIIIARNTFENNAAYGGGALSIFNPYTEPPKVHDNQIAHNTAQYGGGLFCYWSLANVRENNLHDNHASGHGGGIYAEESHNLVVTECAISGNTAGGQGGGLALEGWCTTPQVTDNTIAHNSAANGGGLYCYYVSSPTIRGNQIIQNVAAGGGGGIFCEAYCEPEISLNVVSYNQAVIGGGLYSVNAQPVVTECTFADNHESGLHFVTGWPGHDPHVHQNSIVGNTGYGLRNSDAAVTVSADSNWWGDPSGPYHPTQNPGGLGDRVSDHVTFSPWLLEPGVVAAVEEPGTETRPREDTEPKNMATSGLRLACSPNPFGDATTIDFRVPEAVLLGPGARIAIYDVAGRLVRAYPMRASDHCGGMLAGRFVWVGDDAHGRPAPGGVHYVRLEAGPLRLDTRVVHLR